MAIADLPILTAIRDKMRWHAARQKLLAQNVANADTAGFASRDLKPFEIKPMNSVSAGAASAGPVRTRPAHLGGAGETSADFRAEPARRFETTPSGNAVNLEEEMMKLSANQMDYQAAVGLYERGLSLIRAAVGKRA